MYHIMKTLVQFALSSSLLLDSHRKDNRPTMGLMAFISVFPVIKARGGCSYRILRNKYQANFVYISCISFRCFHVVRFILRINHHRLIKEIAEANA